MTMGWAMHCNTGQDALWGGELSAPQPAHGSFVRWPAIGSWPGAMR